MGSVELVKAGTEVVEPGERTLVELARTANDEHALVAEAAGEMVAHAIRAGEALLRAKAKMPRHEWRDWLEQNVQFHPVWASTYVRLAYYKDVVLGSGAPSIVKAQAVLAGAPPVPSASHLSQEQHDEIRKLHEDGAPKKLIAAMFGVERNTIYRVLNPGFRERTSAQQQQYARRRAAERRALEEQERGRAIKRAVKKAGAAEQELYAMAERMQDVMGQAHREATDKDKRRHYALAGEHYRKMRDEIVRALGVS